MKIVKISKRFCNAYFIIDKGNGIIVDTLYPGSEKFILNKIKEVGIYSFEPKAIFLTHAHFDHVGSARALADFLHIPIISHRLAKSYLEKGENAPIFPYGIKGRLIILGAKFMNVAYKSFSPDIIFDDTMDLTEFGIEAYAFHTPGHTICSSTLQVKGKEAFIGDLLMGTFLPSIPSYPISVASFPTLLKSIERLVSIGTDRFYPGHGAIWEAEKVKRKVKGSMSLSEGILMN